MGKSLSKRLSERNRTFRNVRITPYGHAILALSDHRDHCKLCNDSHVCAVARILIHRLSLARALRIPQ